MGVLVVLEMPLHETFRVLSEPIRLRIIALLTAGELCVCDLMEVLNLPQSTVSRHMSRLKAASLVGDRRAGKWVFYRLIHSESFLYAGLDSIIEKLQDESPYFDDRAALVVHLERKRVEREGGLVDGLRPRAASGKTVGRRGRPPTTDKRGNASIKRDNVPSKRGDAS